MYSFTLQLFPSRAFITVQAGDVIDAAEQACHQFHDADYADVLSNNTLDRRKFKPLKGCIVVVR